MQNRYLSLISCVLMAGVLSACASRDKEPSLLNIRQTAEGPDEFSIVPNKPLTEPPSFSELPPPTPGGSNLTDPTPEADAISALGGRPGALDRPADGGIVNYASRYGRDAGIRGELAAEDLEFRRRNDGRLLEKLFSVNVYFKAYAGMALDQYAELQRWRRKGLRTPAAPPPPEE